MFGRDISFRPVIYLNCSKMKIKNKSDSELIIASLSIYLDMIRKYMFKHYYIENWIMNIDTCGIGVFGLPLKALGMIISNMQLNYCATLEKMFILNPSTGLSAIWSAIEAFIDEETKAKI